MQKTILSSTLVIFLFGIFFFPTTSNSAVITEDVISGSAEEAELMAAFRYTDKRVDRLTKNDKIQKMEEISRDFIHTSYYKKNGRGKLQFLGRFNGAVDGRGANWFRGGSRRDQTSFVRMQTGEYIMRNKHGKSTTVVPAEMEDFDQANQSHRAALIQGTYDAWHTKVSRQNKEREFTVTAFDDGINGLDFTLVGDISGHSYVFVGGVLQD